MSDSDRFGATENFQNDQKARSADKARIADDLAPRELPDRIGRYRVKKLLGRGGFGIVYLAQDEQLDRSVAVKVPHSKLVSRAEDAEPYLAEARTVANLDHPNIVPVYDVGSTDEFPCFVVSKYVAGTDLAAKIMTDRPGHADSAKLVATVAEAAHYAHKEGVVHRDISPRNILIDTEGTPFVVDFGLALREQEVGKGPRYAGTPAYMSPEQARGEGHRVDGRSDVFSLGCVFYELLVGRQPFRADTSAELLEQITRCEPRPLRQIDDTIPREVEEICAKSLAKDPAERYSTAKDLADELRECVPNLLASSINTASLPPATATLVGDKAARQSRFILRGRWAWAGCLVDLTLAFSILLAVVAPLLLPATQAATAARRSQCSHNLRQIGLALHNYYDNHGCYPPAFVADEAGRPMHSWRLLIAPYLGKNALSSRYNFNEPWDGPNNGKLADVPLEVFSCPAEKRWPSTTTSYVAVLGPNTAWPVGKPTKRADFADGPASTILVVEVANSGIHWMEPRDLHVDQISQSITTGADGDGLHVLLADGSVQFLSSNVPVEDLKKFFTIDGVKKKDGEQPFGPYTGHRVGSRPRLVLEFWETLQTRPFWWAWWLVYPLAIAGICWFTVRAIANLWRLLGRLISDPWLRSRISE